MENKKDLKNHALRIKVKEMIKRSKEKELIKSHVDSFKTFPVEEEEHKGKKTSFCR